MEREIRIIGIAGGSGCGKTTLVRRLTEEFGGAIAVLSHDNYYKPHDGLSMEEREAINYDEPAAYDSALLAEHLRLLRQGSAVDCPVYDFTLHTRAQETLRIEPKRVILVEGILILAEEALRAELDLRLFIDSDADLRLARRVRRDVRKRGRTLESVLEQYTNTVRPMHERYVEPSRAYADLIIPGGGKNEAAQAVLSAYIRAALSQD